MTPASLLRRAKRRALDERPGFVEFAALAGIELTESQLELARVAFNDSAPRGAGVWGFIGRPVTDRARRVVAAVCGRGSGKSLLGGLRIVHLALTVDLDGLSKNEGALCPVIAPDLKAARHTVRFAAGVARDLCPDLIVNDTADGFTLRRSRDVRVEARAARASGIGTRGPGYPGAVLDECAFFRDDSHKINDRQIFDAIGPRLMPGGQIVILSSPWAELGLLWELWRENWANPRSALVAHAPTLVMRAGGQDFAHIKENIEAEYAADPIKAAREFGAEFMSAASGAYFDGRAVDLMIDDALPVQVPRLEHATVAVCSDYGFARDSSACVVVQRIREAYVVSVIDEVVPTETPLIPSLVVKRFAAHTRAYGADSQAADQHYRESIREHLLAEDIALTGLPEGASGKAEQFALARTLVHQGQVKSPRHERMIRQLKEIIGKPTSGGTLSIQAPRWATGGHGDIVSALVGALWLAHRLGWQEPEKPHTMDAIEQREVEKWEDERGQSWLERMIPQ